MADEHVTEPERVRALAHPLRLALLDLLEEEGEATATRCAEVTGDSVASCSFHLRILAKYGFIEPGERRGREKPWRVVSRRRTTRPDFDDPASVRAVGALAELTLLAETERIRDFLLGAVHRLPAELRDGVTMTKSSFWATPDELTQLSPGSARPSPTGSRAAGRTRSYARKGPGRPGCSPSSTPTSTPRTGGRREGRAAGARVPPAGRRLGGDQPGRQHALPHPRHLGQGPHRQRQRRRSRPGRAGRSGAVRAAHRAACRPRVAPPPRRHRRAGRGRRSCCRCSACAARSRSGWCTW